MFFHITAVVGLVMPSLADDGEAKSTGYTGLHRDLLTEVIDSKSSAL
jgi:hypothetical protein